MTERFSVEVVEALRGKLTLREAESGAARTRTRSVWRAAIGFSASFTVVLTLALALSAPHNRHSDPRSWELRGTISE
jgi:hypothetical protein